MSQDQTSTQAGRPSSKVTEHRDIIVTRYSMQRGEKVPMHKHPPGFEHITICARGEVAIYCVGDDSFHLLVAGRMFDYNEHQQEHEIEATANDTVVFNIQKKLDR